MRTLTVITAGLSHPSSTRQVADTIAAAVNTAVTARGEGLDVHVIELRGLMNDLARAMTSGGISTPALDEARTRLSDSDGLIAVSPVFQGSYSGLFKMFFDVLGTDALNGMPTIIAATAGTSRHSLMLDHAMRPLLTYLRAAVVPTGVFAATEDWGSGEGGADFERRVARAAAELADRMLADAAGVGGLGGATALGQATTPRRSSGVDPAEDLTPFEELLRGHDGSGDPDEDDSYRI